VSTNPATPVPNPVGAGVVLSVTIKAILIALAALGWVPITEEAIAEVTLAVAAVADALVYFGLIKPGVNQLREQAAAGQAAMDLEQTQTHPRGTTFRDRDLR
jgi:hypothetical protein